VGGAGPVQEGKAMNRPDRRRILQFIGLATLAPAVFSRRAWASETGSLIAPPTSSMRFQRVVTRGAHDNMQISVTRQFEVRFSRFAEGFIVDGQQAMVEVVAPPGLAAFAQLERERVETELFPLALDPFGQIRTEDPIGDRAGQVERAFALATAHIEAQPLAGDERAELQQFVTALHRAGSILSSAMPADLFAPERAAWSEDRAIALPSGDIGRLVSRFDAERDHATGLMRRAMREVLTEIEGDQRRTVEHWELI